MIMHYYPIIALLNLITVIAIVYQLKTEVIHASTDLNMQMAQYQSSEHDCLVLFYDRRTKFLQKFGTEKAIKFIDSNSDVATQFIDSVEGVFYTIWLAIGVIGVSCL